MTENAITLKKDEGAIVTLHENLVRKTVLGFNHSGLRKKVSPEEMVDREIRALQMLENVPGVQRFVRSESDDTFYTKYIPGKSLRDFKRKLDHSYFDMLEEIVIKCHESGVYRIGQNRMDFIVGSNEIPRITDFGNIIFKDDPIAKIPGVVFLAKRYNLLRVADLKKRYTTKEEELSSAENSVRSPYNNL